MNPCILNAGLLKKRQKTSKEKATEEAEYKTWLAGQKQTLSDQDLEKDMSGMPHASCMT